LQRGNAAADDGAARVAEAEEQLDEVGAGQDNVQYEALYDKGRLGGEVGDETRRKRARRG